jgi:hypothetical protein
VGLTLGLGSPDPDLSAAVSAARVHLRQLRCKKTHPFLLVGNSKLINDTSLILVEGFNT